MEKKYDKLLIARVEELRLGLGKQPLASLRMIDSTLVGSDEEAAKLRRILSKKAFPGDEKDIKRMEKAKARLIRSRK